MYYYRYNIEKKELSYDRGVTWVDAVGDDSRRVGALVGVYDTFEECNSECELEKYDILLVDEQKNNNICSTSDISYNKTLPSGIASVVRFTSGMYCCVDTWGSSDNKVIDKYHNAQWITPTATITDGWNGVREYNTFNLAGREMQSCGFCGQQTCYTITEWMPWVENLSTLKVLYLVKYVRQECSGEWQIDETVEPVRVCFGERWVKIYEDFYKATWQHQIATGVTTSSPYVVSWENDGQPFDQTFNVTLPEGLELIPEIRNDGVASNVANLMLNKVQIKIALNGNGSGDVTSRKYAYSSTVEGCDWYISSYQGGAALDSSCNYDYYTLSNSFKAYNLTPYQRANYASLFAGMNIYMESVWQARITLVDKLNNTRSGEIILFDEYPLGIGFPYKIPADYGYQDSYDNASEYGYIFRDGRRIILEYKNSSGTKRSGDNPF